MARRKVLALMTNNAGTRDDYQGSLRSAVEQACLDLDLDLWVYAGRTDYRPSRGAQLQVFRLVSPRRVDGIVVAAGALAATSSFEPVLGFVRNHCHVPICSVGQLCEMGASVLVDNRTGAARLAEHLVEVHRCRRFAYIAGPCGHGESEQRIQATRDTLARYGLELGPEAIGYGDFLPASGTQVAHQLLDRELGIDVVIAGNDNMALGALQALDARGLRCPEHLAVVGFDDAAVGRTSHPSLTTVRQPVERLGAVAVDLVAQGWAGQTLPACVTLETELVVRESCGCHGPHHAAARDLTTSERATSRFDEVLELLVPLIEDRDRRAPMADALCRAVEDERAGHTGALVAAFEELMSSLARPNTPTSELHRVITVLRGASRSGEASRQLEDAFNDARLRVASEACRREEDWHWQTDAVLEELRITGEQLATALTLPALKGALVASLPRFGVKNAIVSLYERDTLDRLVPWVQLADGVPVPCRTDPHPAELLFPDDAVRPLGRCSMTVMPLTSLAEHLGVVMLEFPAPLDVFTLLREHIGNAVKTAYLHDEILTQERLNAQAQEEQRVTAAQLRSLATIAGGVAHDLNNALGPLLALPEAIRRSLEGQMPGGLPEEVLEDLDTIQAAGGRASHTIHDLLSLGQATDLPKTVFDLSRLLQRESGTLVSACEGNGRIAVRVTPCDCALPMRASKPHLIRAVLNLVLNARDAIQGSGSIVVRALRRDLDAPITGVDTIVPGYYAVVEVEDTGTGIAEQLLPRIFEPFFTAKAGTATSGTGLGLAIVQRIVKDCGGYLRVESKIGTGTTFGLYFPIQAEQDCASSVRPAPAPRGSERILVVDDDSVQLRTARRILKQLGYAVTTIESGEKALELCLTCPDGAPFDLLIVDMIMPGALNGIATIEQVRATRSQQKAIVVSGFAPEQMEALARERGVRWLPKPYTTTQLASVVRAALDEQPEACSPRSMRAAPDSATDP
jgi:sigma-B regulation protein RsbU (phosphoserine phosphatase)